MPPIPDLFGGANGWLFWVCAVILIGGVLWKPGSVIWKRIKDFAQFLDEWAGKPEKRDRAGKVTQEAVPGVASRLLDLERYTERIHHEVTPNHGGSIKDAVKRTEEAISELKNSSGETQDNLFDLKTTSDETATKLDEHIIYAKTSDRKLVNLELSVNELKKHHEA